MTDDTLHYADLDKRHWAIPPETAAEWTQLVRVCLDRHHTPPGREDAKASFSSLFNIAENGVARSARAEWTPPEARTKNAWTNRPNEATDRGACAIALAALEITRNLVAVTPGVKGSGADYRLDHPRDDLFDYYISFGESPGDFETAYRVEISGVGHGGESVLMARLKEKMRQLIDGKDNLPALAMVVGFEALKVFVTDVERE